MAPRPYDVFQARLGLRDVRTHGGQSGRAPHHSLRSGAGQAVHTAGCMAYRAPSRVHGKPYTRPALSQKSEISRRRNFAFLRES